MVGMKISAKTAKGQEPQMDRGADQQGERVRQQLERASEVISQTTR